MLTCVTPSRPGTSTDPTLTGQRASIASYASRKSCRSAVMRRLRCGTLTSEYLDYQDTRPGEDHLRRGSMAKRSTAANAPPRDAAARHAAAREAAARDAVATVGVDETRPEMAVVHL